MTDNSLISTLYNRLVDRPVQHFTMRSNRFSMVRLSKAEKRIVYQQAVLGWLETIAGILFSLYLLISLLGKLLAIFNVASTPSRDLDIIPNNILLLWFSIILIIRFGYLIHGYVHALILCHTVYSGVFRVITTITYGRMSLEHGREARILILRSAALTSITMLLFFRFATV